MVAGTLPLRLRASDSRHQAAASHHAPRASAADHHIFSRVFAVSFAVNLGMAWVLANIAEIGNADGLSRTANAWYVLFSRDPHLSAIGFVWPVLPSLVQIPLLPLVRYFNMPELAGWAMSAGFGAATLAVLAAILGHFGIRGWLRITWLLAIQVHPQFWYLSATGLAETPALFFLGLAILALLHVGGSDLSLSLIGLALVSCFFVRYEALGFMAGFALVLVLLQDWAPRRDSGDGSSRLFIQRLPGSSLIVRWWPERRDRIALEGRLLAVLTPSIYGIVFWLLVNWMIMGDPLYFERSEFSLAAAPDVARNLGPTHPLWTAMYSVPITAEYAIKRLSQVQAAIVPLLGLAVGLGFWQRNRQLLGLAVLTLVVVGFTCAQIFVGTLPPFLRYWSYTTVFAVVLAAACCAALHAVSSRLGTATRYTIPLLLFLSAVICAASMREESASFDERRLGAWLMHDMQANRELVAVDFWWIRAHDSWILSPIIDEISSHGPTLIDVETGYPTILRVKHPERLVISPDSDFTSIIDFPQKHLRYIAVTDPRLGGKRDLVNSRYPGLYEGDVPWARLVGEVDGTIQMWRIYEVVPDLSSPLRGGERDQIDRGGFRADVAPAGAPDLGAALRPSVAASNPLVPTAITSPARLHGGASMRIESERQEP